MKKFESYEEFCKAFRNETDAKESAILLLHLQNWLNTIFDNISEDDMDFGLDEFYTNKKRVPQKLQISKTDILSHISDYAEVAIKHIETNMREKIMRENVLMPIYKAKELNSYGINWLSRKPGRTIREKISGSNSIMAVKRRMSLDTGENRLFVAFMKQLRDLYDVKIDNLPANFLDDSELDFYQVVGSFLRTDDIDEIQRWENLPPNNTLLSDVDYKKIWRAWNDLKEIDSFIKYCCNNVEECLLTMFFFELVAEAKDSLLIPQLPLQLNYSDFLVNLIIPDVVGVDPNGNVIKIAKEDKKIKITFKNRNFEVFFENNIIKAFEGNTSIVSGKINAGNLKSYSGLLIKKIGCSAIKQIVESTEPKKMKSVAIDLFDVRPSYINENGILEELPYRLLQQEISLIQNENVEKYFQSCESSDAIILQDENTGRKNGTYNFGEINTYTISSAIDDESSEHMKLLFQMLSKQLVTNDLTYIFPDLFDEFQLSLVHKTARLSYHKVKAFPKSIGVVFNHQNTSNFNEKFEANDFALIVDIVDDELSFTLVKGVYNEELYSKMPQYKGVMWERHPTFSKSCKDVIAELADKLLKDGCQTPELLYKIFGLSGLKQEANKLTCFFGEEDFYKVSDGTTEILDGIKIPITDVLEEFLDDRKDIVGDSKVHIIMMSNAFVYSGNRNYVYKTGDDALSGHRCHELLKYKYDIPLWRDHLPDLAIKKLYGKFDLVNQATVLPNFNSVQSIKIDNTFTLVKGKKSYHFDLIKNDMNSKKQYEAVIKHSAFPLKEDVECALKMTYHYGAEEPYELLFVPLDKKNAGFIEAKVQWKRKTDFPYEDLEYPDFPEDRTWYDLMEYPDQSGTGTNDLTKILTGFFKNIGSNFESKSSDELGFEFNELVSGFTFDIEQLIDGEYKTVVFEKKNLMKGYEKSKNPSNMISYKLRLVEKKKERCYIDLEDAGYKPVWFKKDFGHSCIREYYHDGSFISVAFYESNFKDASQFNPDVTRIYFDLKLAKNGRYKAFDIVPKEIENANSGNYEAIAIRRGICPEMYAISNFMLFVLHTVFFNGKSVYDVDCPETVREAFEDCVNHWLRVHCECDDIFAKVRLFMMMSLMANDIGDSYYYVANNYLEDYKNHKIKLSDSIGYALGGYTSENQRNLFEAFKELKESKVICILSKAIWKNSDLIFNLPIADVLYYFDCAITELVEMYESSARKLRKDVSMYIEFIIGVFRLRQTEDEQICKKLSMNNANVRKLYSFVEQIIADKIEIRTHLQLDINKKGEFENSDIPDLLFVLLMYITGNTGESDIRISGVNSDEQGDD